MSIFLLFASFAIVFASSDDSGASISQSGDYTDEEFTPTVLQQLRNDIRQLINDNNQGLTFESPLSTIYDFNAFDENDAPDPTAKNNRVLIPSIIRLVFHDCGGTSEGCDGCIDLTNEENGGLFEGAVDPLSDICDYYNDRYSLSYADCWALAGTFAVEMSNEDIDEIWSTGVRRFADNPPSQVIFQGDIPYYVGRRDCEATPDNPEGEDDNLPEGDWGWDLSRQYMADTFGMTNREIVNVIAGGHSLGRGHIRASGYSGTWDVSQGVIDNEYHWNLIPEEDRTGFEMTWQQSKLFDETVDAELAPLLKPQFNLLMSDGFVAAVGFPNNRLFLMLNVDIDLYWDLSYYFERGLENEIDCAPHPNLLCPKFFPGTVIGNPGETQDDYPGEVLCPYRQCPIHCEGGQAQLDDYIANDFANLDDNADCPAGFIQEGFIYENEFGASFISAFNKMITTGYEISQNDDSDSSDSSESSSDSGTNRLTIMQLPN